MAKGLEHLSSKDGKSRFSWNINSIPNKYGHSNRHFQSQKELNFCVSPRFLAGHRLPVIRRPPIANFLKHPMNYGQ